MRYRIAVALLCGAGFASLSLLLIRVSLPSPVSLLLSLLLLPGGVLAHLVVRSEDLGPPLLVLAANALVYSAVAYGGVSILGRRVVAEKMRLVAITLAVPVAILVSLVCIPAFNPLWPRGMMELANQEKELQTAVPVGVGVDEVRIILRSKGIQFYENTEERQNVVLDNGKGESLIAAAGDRVISARFQTPATEFPCGYDMQIVLLFGLDNKLKQQYVHRLRLCP